MKKIIGLLTIIITSLLFMTGVKADTTSDIISARQNGVDLKTASGVKVDKKIPKAYSYFAVSKIGLQNTTYSGVIEVPDAVKNTWNVKGGIEYGTPSLVTEAIKGKYSALYKKVGTYNGEFIDVKATVMDYAIAESQYLKSDPYMILNATYLGNSNAGLKWVTIKYEFFKSGTTTPVSVKGNTTYWDVDWSQGVIIHDNNEGIYTKSDNKLKLTKISNRNYVFDIEDYEASERENPELAFSEIFAGTSITRTFTYGNPDDYTPWYTSYGGQMLYATPLLPSETPKPVKTADKEEVSVGDEYTYTISQEVPQMLSDFYYKSFSIEDILEPCLMADKDKVSIENEEGTEVTGMFNVSGSGQTLKIELVNPSDENFYGHAYKIKIKTNIKEGYDLSKYKEDNYYVIPNHATVKIKDYEGKDETTDTNEVKTKVPEQLEPTQVVQVPNTLAGIPLIALITGTILLTIAIFTGFYMYIQKKKI